MVFSIDRGLNRTGETRKGRPADGLFLLTRGGVPVR
jgi:hypothetical protein